MTFTMVKYASCKPSSHGYHVNVMIIWVKDILQYISFAHSEILYMYTLYYNATFF